MNLASLIDLPSLMAPDLEVLVAHRGGSWDYATLRDRVGRFSTLVRRHGCGRGDRVGVLATNAPDAVAAILGAAAVGAIAVPMNYKAAADELEHLLTDSGVVLLFTDERYVDLVETVRPPSLTTVIVLDDTAAMDALLASLDDDDEIADVDEDDIAVLLYTSGTTSHPKGVQLTHEALTRYVMSTNDVADGRDEGRMILAAPLYHVAGLTSLLHAVYCGRVVVTIPQFSVDDWLDAVEGHRVTHSFLVPTMLSRLTASSRLTLTDLSSLRSITYGAAPMPPPVIERAIAAFPAHVEFSGAYGQTETTSTVAVLSPDDHRLVGTAEDVARRRERLRSVGRIVGEVELRIIDDLGDEVPTGSIGEVQLRTYRTMRGYWGTAERTRVAIDDEGWVHTGDLGRVDDGGYLFLVGRRNDMIIRGGENVSPEEVEGILHGHPGVVEVGVHGEPDLEWGERIIASVVLDGTTGIADVERHARAHLAPFKRPSEYRVMDALPRTSTGKLLRRLLLAPAADSGGVSTIG